MGLDTIEFVLWAENEFQIEIPAHEAANILTVGQFSTYVYQKLICKHESTASPENEIFERIKNFLASEFSIESAIISHDSCFVNDLRLDQ